MKVQWDGEYMDPPLEFPTNGVFKKPYLLKFIYQNSQGLVGVIEKNFSEEFKYFQKKYLIKIELLSDEKLIIPEYKIELLNRSRYS